MPGNLERRHARHGLQQCLGQSPLAHGLCRPLEDRIRGSANRLLSSLKATLNHILIIDWSLRRRPGGRQPGSGRLEQPAALRYARRAHTRAGARRSPLDRFLRGADRGGLERSQPRAAQRSCANRAHRSAADASFPASAVHHRGQAHAMLSATPVKPPQLDEFFSEGEAPLRAGEFAKLGWTEAQIWSG